MSIIYDALKKVENKLELTEAKDIASGIRQIAKKKPYYFYLVAVVAGLALASVTYNVVTKNYLAKTIKATPNDYAQAKLGLALNLNGIFFSGDTSYALINNQIVKEGDTVMGVTVKRITSKDVELLKNGVVVKLSSRE
jgi:hypothetical protein